MPQNEVVPATGVGSVTAGNGTVVVGGTAVAPTVRAATLVAKSADYTAVTGDLVHMTGSHTVTLPAAVTGATVGVVSVNGTGAAPCTISAPGGNILGPGVAASATSILLGTAAAFVVLQNDGTNWNVVAGAQDSGWIAPALGNSWTAGTTIAYRLLADRVYFQGNFTPGGASGSSPFTLPAGYRPAQLWVPIGGGFNGAVPAPCQMQISTNGVLLVFYVAATTNLGPDGLSFSVSA